VYVLRALERLCKDARCCEERQQLHRDHCPDVVGYVLRKECGEESDGSEYRFDF
jgi:hypothetical protein